VISANKSAWDLPDTPTAALQQAHAGYLSIDDNASGPDATSSWRLRRRLAYKAYTREIRAYVNRYMNNNPKIGPAERREAGLHVYGEEATVEVALGPQRELTKVPVSGEELPPESPL
jgi:hypothetical protein